MANFSAADVKKLRDATGAGMMDCKNALAEADGDFDQAIEVLRVSWPGQGRQAGRRALGHQRSGGLHRRRPAAARRRDRLRGQERRVPEPGRRRRQGGRREQGRRRRRGQRGAAAVGPDRRGGRRAAGRQDRREARDQQRGLLRRPDGRLPAQARLGPAAAGRCAGGVRGQRRDRGPDGGDAHRRDEAAVPEPRRGPGRDRSRTSAGSPRPRPRSRASRSRPGRRSSRAG